MLCPGGHLLSPTLTTIGPSSLNDRVRDGNGCDPAGSATKTKYLLNAEKRTTFRASKTLYFRPVSWRSKQIFRSVLLVR